MALESCIPPTVTEDIQASNALAEELQPAPVISAQMAEQETMGERLRRLRGMKGWSLREAADQFGVSHATVDKWERGENLSMRPETLYAVAQAYGTDPAYILWGEDRTPPNDRTGRFKRLGG